MMTTETIRVFQRIATHLETCAGKAAADDVRAFLRDAVRAEGGIANDEATEFTSAPKGDTEAVPQGA